MKKNVFLLVIFLAPYSFLLNGQTPFNRGVNLTGWFQASNSHQIPFAKYSKQDLQNIKSLGCDVVRLPINLFGMDSESPNYTLDPLFLEFLDNAVNWAEELQLYLILDNHSTDDLASNNPNLEAELTSTWAQMALRYKNRSKYIIYEILNEPNGFSTQIWGAMQQKAINAIRNVDADHFIIVGGSGWNTYTELNSLPFYTDNKLIYTFHFYDPFVFTHQGASWSTPSMETLANVPFPYNEASMPSTPPNLVGTWIESTLNYYKYDGNVAKVKSLIDIAVNFKTARNANIYCGEFGVYNKNSNDADRVYWYSEVRKYLEEKGIAWTSWDYQAGFGIFKKGSNELFDYDVNIPLVNALGLIAPPQQVYSTRPDSVGFPIYTDYICTKITEANILNNATVDFYLAENPNNGKRCLQWENSNQYGTVGFDFIPDKDLSKLVANNYAISMIVKGNSTNTSFDLRFMDSKKGTTDHPWRMNYTVNDSKVSWDNKWHKLYIPLSNFQEGGAWDSGSWYNSIGAFNWKEIDRFDIVSEQSTLYGKKLWFDNIQLSNLDTAKIYSNPSGIKDVVYNSSILSVLPNPVADCAKIKYLLDEDDDVEIYVSNLSGQKIRTLVNERCSKGVHELVWNRDPQLKSGLYLCILKSRMRFISTKFMVN